MIYFLETDDGRAYKIGYTGQGIAQRLRGLEDEYGHGFRLLGTIPGDRKQEKAIHRRFAHHRRYERCRFTYRRELFEPVAEILDFFKSAMEDAGSAPGPLPPVPVRVVRIDRAIAGRAKIAAARQGVDLTRYLSDAIRDEVTREWKAIVSAMDQEPAR